MIEMEFNDGKNEDGEIHFKHEENKNETRKDDACHGHLLLPEAENAFNVCLDKKENKAGNENDHKRSLKFWERAIITEYRIIQIEYLYLRISQKNAGLPLRPGLWELVEYHTGN